MPQTHLQTLVMLGLVVSNLLADSAPPDCLASTHVCRSLLCRSEHTFHSQVCEDGGCQIKDSMICNMTIKTVLDQFPSLRACLCVEEQEEELCGSVHDLATQCLPQPAAQVKRSTKAGWGESDLKDNAYGSSGTCSDQVRACVSDSVCNRHLAPVLLACAADHCVPDQCRGATQDFYAQMPIGVAEMLAMCDCNSSDQSCMLMKWMLHSGACGQETELCLETVNQCVTDSECRGLFVNFQSKCWHEEDRHCTDGELGQDCFTHLDQGLILGSDSACIEAYIATLGTPLHHPCSCEQLQGEDLLSCSMILHIFHDRSHFINPLTESISSEPPAADEPEEQTYYVLYTCAAVFPVILCLLILAVTTKLCMRRKKKRFHPPQKSNCVLVL
ncbi:GDNF family receptor alpha-like [Synchiropus splendidus]|uniref:GDNF family receptor alpha-like n=1 Tax=Synchiropus splendidus TaxID=270530 RepID=UPI00237DFA65|nr:GDNF family receptor alpha-like [Synchiropus splendidus]